MSILNETLYNCSSCWFKNSGKNMIKFYIITKNSIFIFCARHYKRNAPSLELSHNRCETITRNFLVNFFYYDLSCLTSHFSNDIPRYPIFDWTICSIRWNDIEIRALDFIRFLCYYFPSKSLRKLPLFRTTIDKREITPHFTDNILLVEGTWPTIAIPFWNILNGSLRNDRFPSPPPPPQQEVSRGRERGNVITFWLDDIQDLNFIS